MKFITLLSLVTLIILGQCDKILVVLDNSNLLKTHSKWLNLLQYPRNNQTKQNQIQIAYSFGKNNIELKNYDRFKYQHIIIMSTSEKEMDSKIKVRQIVNYFDEGGNVIIIGDIDTSISFRKLFYAFGIQLDEQGSRVKDHFSNFKSSDLIATKNYQSLHPFLANTHKPLLYRGIGMSLVNYQNYQLYNLIKAEATTFSKSEKKDTVLRAGSTISLVAGIQGLNNARALISGSLDFFSDQILSESKYDNQQAIRQLVNWTFRKNGIVKVNGMYYQGVGSNSKESLFNVGQKVYFETQIQELDIHSDKWKPYITDDLQVQLVMLDPWVRVPLKLKEGKTSKYQASFYTPLKEGIYQFKIIYNKPGFNFLKLSERVTVRPYKHDEFERFLFVASPYFFGLFSTIIATFAFIVIYLYSSWGKGKQQ